jgi:transmembrane sensor
LNITPLRSAEDDIRPDARLQSEAHRWLILLTSGRATVADGQALQAWCAQSPEHARAFAEARSLWHGLESAAHQMVKPRALGRRVFIGGALAASAALFMVSHRVPGGFAGLTADYQTRVGEQRSISLGNGLTLELNTQTRLNHRTLPAGMQDIELLGGEIEVQAMAQASVRVQAGSGWMAAQGARFNVRTSGESICVTCLEGTVQVDVQGQRVSLSQGRQLTYESGVIGAPQSFDPSVITAWTQQLLVFNDATLASVIDEINRYRPGMLVLLNRELGKRKVQARFRLDQLAGVALLIRDAYGAKCTELPGGVVLLS